MNKGNMYQLSKRHLDDRYIAGFFDGDGSPMIIAIRRIQGQRICYRFRPIIKVAQKNREILDAIKNTLGIGHVDQTPKDKYARHQFIVNGLDSVLFFVKRIAPHAAIKRLGLEIIGELASFQKENLYRSRHHYSQKEMWKMLDLRDRLFLVNQKRKGRSQQKYSTEQIVSEDWRMK